MDLLASSQCRFSLWILSLTTWWSLPECQAQWWSIAQQTALLGGSNSPELLLLSAAPNFCSNLDGLSKGQQRLCTLYQDHMLSVAQGARLAIAECQLQFRNRRWNCSAFDNKTDRVFGPVMKIGSRESAFVNAISSAGVTYAISRSCREGELSSCGCSRAPRPKKLNPEWQWGGCGDNVHYAYQFTEGFVDLREKEKNFRGKADRMEKARALMNLHNNAAGRRAVFRAAKPTCKCHGVSGSCSLRTCWHELPPFGAIGRKIKAKYDAAAQVEMGLKNKLEVVDPEFVAPTAEDMVYLSDSPDYCVLNKKTGSLGTKDRRCNPSSQGTDGCDIMCCGRGFNTRKETSKKRCDCKFKWCCKVVCKMCPSVEEVHTCK